MLAERLLNERGSGLVAGIVMMFSFTFLGLVWLAHDVDRGLSNESTAQSIAFQSARSAAQQTSIADARSGSVGIDPSRACASAADAASRLFVSYAVNGEVARCEVDVERLRVTVEVVIDDGSISVRGIGIVSTERTQ
jgi:Tfp pilus assembly protein PilX